MDKFDRLQLEKIYNNANIDKFFNSSGLRDLLKTIITELYISNKNEVLQLSVNHLDRALLKYNLVCTTKHIENPKQYFKACILSAIKEKCLYEQFSVFDEDINQA
jgi:hypothetical protein